MSTNDAHNPRSRDAAKVSQILLVALRRGRPEHSGETEGVVVRVEGTEVTLGLDDGESLIFDVGELRGALSDAA